MASLLTEPLYEISGQSPPPGKTFYHFFVTKSNVTWRWWKISLRAVDRFTKPGELKQTHQEFLEDVQQQWEVSTVFGRRTLEYTKSLCQGHYDYLVRLPDFLLLRIINHLELEDVDQLGRTSHKFMKLCGSEKFWEQAAHQQCNKFPVEVASLALEVGWRNIFFTSKLQLQKMLSRRRLQSMQEQGGQVFDPDTKMEESPGARSETDLISCPEQGFQVGIISDPSFGTETGSGFDTSSCCDADPDPYPESEADSIQQYLILPNIAEQQNMCGGNAGTE